MEPTADLSRFVAGLDLSVVPAEVLDAAKRSIMDGLGLAVAGSRTAGAVIARGEVESYGCQATEATALGTGLRLPARFAAFLNGLAIHADDYDDTQLAVLPDRVYGLLTHPTAPVLPAALALAEERDAAGADLLVAYLAGVEVETKVAEAISPRHYDAGFHSTGTAGAIGSAAAAARLLGYDAAAVAITLGIGASLAAGLRENFGTMTKPLHAGRAAESGVLAARLAGRGFTAAANVLEARRGFFSAAGGGYDAAMIEGRAGNPWTFADPGVSIKPHPSGSLTHPAMTALAELIEEHDIRPADVARVTVGTNRHMPNALIHHQPQDELAAKFSMEFCIAILLLRRRAGLAEFTDEVVRSDEAQAMLSRVEFGVDPEAEAAGYNTMTSIVRVFLHDGRVLEARAAFGTGSPERPMSPERLRQKFLECTAAGGIADERAIEAADRIAELEKQTSIREIVAALSR